MIDLVIRGGTIVTPDGPRRAEIAVEDGRIREVAPEIGGGREEVDAGGLLVLPAVIDVHLHFNEPGRTDWEGGQTGSRALAAGGGTLFFDMPLNSTPCTLTAREFDRKHAALEAVSITDFALWGGLVPGAVPAMAEMAARGVVGFKAFMCDSGLPEFPRADDVTLLDGMREAARLGRPVAVHAESEEITRGLASRAASRDARAFLDSRPLVAELEAIQRALLLAQETGVRLHLVHVSSGRGVVVAAEARARGVDVSIETCPHYLFFTEDDLERLGPVAKCAPPLRPRGEQDALWETLLAGDVDIVASDHSPAPPALKAGDVMSAWGGIAGVQSLLPVLLERGLHARGLSIERVASLVSGAPARRFGVRSKGAIVAGMDADVAFVDIDRRHTLEPGDLFQRHAISPYLGASFRGLVRRTIRRGATIFADGRVTATGGGMLVRPS